MSHPLNSEQNSIKYFRVEQLRNIALFASKSPLILIPITIASVIVWGYTANWKIFLWDGLIVLTIVAHMIYSKSILEKMDQINIDNYVPTYLFITVAYSTAVGLAGPLFLGEIPLISEMKLCAIIICLLLTGASISSYSIGVFIAYTVPSTLLFILGSFRANELEVYLAVSLLPILAYIQFFQTKMNIEHARQNFFTKIENKKLIDSLKVERKIAGDERDRAENANLAKSQFLAAASHDLRQPLHAANLYIAVLKARSQKFTHYQTDIVDIVTNIENALTSTSSLLDTLLDISKLDAGVVKTEIKIFPLHQLFQKMDHAYRLRAEQKKLSFNVEPTNAHIVSDPILFERILRNLLDNAIKYTHQGSVRISARSLPYTVQIIVEDTGIGIPDSAKNAIFKEFFQIGNLERNQEKGLGLGLAIAHRTAELLNVKLSLQSTLGSGSRFLITVQAFEKPVIETTDTHIDSSKNQKEILYNKRILFIDDEENVGRAMTDLLKTWGAEVYSFKNLESAQQHIRNSDWHPELIISDMRLHNAATGLHAISCLRQQVGEVPAFLISGDTSPERIAMAHKQNTQILFKPVNPSILKQYMEKIFVSNVV